MRQQIADIILRTLFGSDQQYMPEAMDCADEILKTIQTPPVPETPASGHEWRIHWISTETPTRYGSSIVVAPDEASAIAACETMLERKYQMLRTKFSITSCSMILAVLTNGETEETFRSQEND